MWFIGAGEDFYAIDATPKRFDALWRVPDVGSTVASIARSSSACRFLLGSWGWQEWHYELPSLKLRSRKGINLMPEVEKFIRHTQAIAISADSTIANHSTYFSGEGSNHMIMKQDVPTLWLAMYGKLSYQINICSADSNPLTPSIFSNWVAAPVIEPDEARVVLIDVQQGKIRAEITLERAANVAVRMQRDVVTIADNRGRFLVMNLADGKLIRNLRL